MTMQGLGMLGDESTSVDNGRYCAVGRSIQEKSVVGFMSVCEPLGKDSTPAKETSTQSTDCACECRDCSNKSQLLSSRLNQDEALQ